MAGQRRRQSRGDGGGCAGLRIARRRHRSLKSALAGAIAISVLAACGESGVTGLDHAPGQIARGPAPSTTVPALDQQLLGTWSRVAFFIGADGFLLSSEIRWTFDADGRVTRRSILTNFSLAFIEEVVAVGQWRTDGALLTINWLAPVQDTFVSEYRITPTLHGARLLLGQQHFDRVAPF